MSPRLAHSDAKHGADPRRANPRTARLLGRSWPSEYLRSEQSMKRPTHREDTLDPRIERSRSLILQAAVAELGEVGYGAFTIESVAARSGVAKSTIYRHWSDKLALIANAFETFHEQQGPDIASGSPRERAERIVHHVAEVVGHSIFSACIPALIDGAERDPRLRKFHHRFQKEARQPLIAVIAEGVVARDFPSDIDPEIAALALLGVIFYRRLMSSAPFDPERASELVATVLGAHVGGRSERHPSLA
jgi:TetR/AcrR family transcriptional regulator of autoinduction and epiphytic fitness